MIKKEAQVNFFEEPRIVKLIDQAASDTGNSRSGFIREAVRDKLRQRAKADSR